MSLSRVFAAAAIAATFSFSGAEAQGLSDSLVPAEFPPGSYQGRQYVDSQGCVFIRAGIDGNVTWVPRVTRSRKVICGFQPTFARKAPAGNAAAQPVTAPAATAKVPASKAKPVRRTAVRSVVSQPAEPAASGGQAACRGANAVSQQYVGRVGQNVRCGPQKGSFAAYIRRDDDRGAQGKYRGTARVAEPRVVPRHVYENQVASRQGISMPKGYEPSWNDDRLNPSRAHQTLTGKAQMEQVWTNTVPRKLIIRPVGQATGHTGSTPYVAANSSGTSVVLSTRSTTAGATTASHRYVQAGLFSTDAKARAAAKRIAKAGLPASMAKVRHKGRGYLSVLAGPFSTQAQLDDAVRRVRAAGYREPRLRK
ncbi:SPOR domain-containing protein [Roseovarius aestuarii]|uniref:Sporulation related domain protein n=1 Tax=Roseovarius aestuarii TaxID=475083 RepID=A0A1X7BXD0_9RHOB|nr:SPOR domain-containing protein [Roseovarius aestuarii]SMC14301.1 Sporulation related domain protein [Roseovarius aestuarii]